MEIKRLSKLSNIGVIDPNNVFTWRNIPSEEEIREGKIIQVIFESGVYFVEYIPKDKIEAYESGIDKIEQSQEESHTINHVDAKLFEARKTVLNKDIFAGGKYSGKEIGYIIDNDPEYIDMYLHKSTNTYIKDKIQYILDNMEG